MLSEKQKKITQYLQNSFLFITFAPKKYRINLMSDEIDDIKDSEVNGEDTTQEHSDTSLSTGLTLLPYTISAACTKTGSSTMLRMSSWSVPFLTSRMVSNLCNDVSSTP